MASLPPLDPDFANFIDSSIAGAKAGLPAFTDAGFAPTEPGQKTIFWSGRMPGFPDDARMFYESVYSTNQRKVGPA